MITIVSGTNRKNSNSSKLARYYLECLDEKGVEAQIFDLANLSSDFMKAEMYGNRTPAFEKEIDTFFTQADKWIFVFPEYNGGFPGALKLMIDAIDPKVFHGKRVALTGLSAGHAGNLRGLDHMTGVLHYLQAEVLSDKPKFSQFHTLFLEEGGFDETLIKRVNKQIEKLLNF